MLRVGALGDRDDAWDAFVATDAASTFCHLSGWRRVMSKALGHRCDYRVVEDDDGRIHGVLPLVHVKGVLGHFVVSIPFVNDGGPLGSDDARELLVTDAVEVARRSGAKLLELRSRQHLPGPVRATDRKITVLLDLPESTDELWSKTFRSKVRSQIRRPMKEGMTASSGHDQLDAFYAVFARNMRDLGTPVLPRSFFAALVATFGDAVRFSTVRSADGVTAAAGCCVRWRDEQEIVWASSLREYNPFSPNMLLYASVMEDAVRSGVRRFNFGRCTPGGPTHRFKQQWGGYDIPLPWPSWSRDGAVGPPTPDKPIFQLATSVWSRLPLGIANRLGPIIARQIP